MEIEIREKAENAALGRTEISFLVKYESAVPSRKEVREKLISALSCDPKLLVIARIQPSFGSRTARAEARLYNSEKALLAEKKHLLVRDGLREKEKKGEKAAAPKSPPAKQ